MHRDISDGNVMMLSEEQTFSQRMQTEEERPMNVSRLESKALADSKKALRKVLKELGDRKPTGMLSDFDLSMRHLLHSTPSSDVNLVESTPQTGSTTRSARARDNDTVLTKKNAKRRKSNANRSIPAPPDRPTNLQKDNQPPLESQNEKRRAIDYRTVSKLNPCSQSGRPTIT